MRTRRTKPGQLYDQAEPGANLSGRHRGGRELLADGGDLECRSASPVEEHVFRAADDDGAGERRVRDDVEHLGSLSAVAEAMRVGE